MRRLTWLTTTVLLCGACGAPTSITPPVNGNAVLDFEQAEVGVLPAGFVVEATTPVGPLATWEVVAEGDGKALRMTRPNHDEIKTYNLCWSRDRQFGDGSLEVRVRAETGEDDQGGGLMWRVIDANNYYIARYNPLETNYRLYVVKGGVRKQLESAKVEGAAGTWFTLKIDHVGDHIVCSLDGVPLLDAKDATFPSAGGVGFWTKADAVTTFDDLKITPAPIPAK